MIEEPKVIIEQDLMRRVVVQVLRNQRALLMKAMNHTGVPLDDNYSTALPNTNDLLSELED